MKRIVIIHTVRATLDNLSNDIRNNTSLDAEFFNIYDDFFAQVKKDDDPAEVQKLRMQKLKFIISSAEVIHPDAVIVACSTLSLEASFLKGEFSVPVIPIDDAMIDHVTSGESSVILFATSPNPVYSVESRLRERAKQKGRQIYIKTLVCEDALPYLLCNDMEGLKKIVLDHVKNEVPHNTPVVLAQNSSGFMKEDIETITGSRVYYAAPFLYAVLNKLFNS